MARRIKRGVNPDRAPDLTLDDLAETDGTDVDELLREVSKFRLALETDLTIAAAAADAVAEHGAPASLSAELTNAAVDAGRSGIANLELVIESKSLQGQPIRRRAQPRPSRSKRLPVGAALPIVAVALTLGFGGGVFAGSHDRSAGGGSISNAADSSLATLTSALGRGNAAAASQAGDQLRSDVSDLIAKAATDPAAAQAAAAVLVQENAVISSIGGPVGDQLRSQMQSLVTQLQNATHTPIATLLPSTGSPAGTVSTPAHVTVTLPGAPTAPAASIPAVIPSTVKHLVPTHVPSLTPTGLVASVIAVASSPASTAAPAIAPTPSAAATAATPSTSVTPTATATPSTPGLTLPTPPAAGASQSTAGPAVP